MDSNQILNELLVKLLQQVSKLLEKSEANPDFLRRDKQTISTLNRLKNSSELLRENINTLKISDKFKKELDFVGDEEKTSLSEEIASEEKRLFAQREVILREAERIITEENVSNDNCIVEIRPGVGGIEASIFTNDLYQMYYLLAAEKNWIVEIIESRPANPKGNSLISFSVKGKGSYQMLKNESGVHRVQRVPETENKGRIQTSTVSVVVLPEIGEVNDLNIKIEAKDIKIDTYRSSGAGGQHVNTTDSAIRITHIPTQIVSTSQDGRSQADNKEKAMTVLRARIYEKELRERNQKLGDIRNSAIGNSERSEKIRTYNYPQNRITDHRIENDNEIVIKNGKLSQLCQNLSNFFRSKEKEKKIVELIDYLRAIE